MEKKKGLFVAGEPAMKLGDALVIADLHLGITSELWESGVALPSQVKKLAEKINALKKKTKTRRLIIAGDFKHSIPLISWQERREIPEFVATLDYEEITIVKGNHDGGIEKIIPAGVKVKKSLPLGKFIVTHGHRNIMTKKKFIVIGHNQPHIVFRDEMGARYTEPVWVRGPLTGKLAGKQLVIMPAFNELAGAAAVNRGELLGPIAKKLDMKRAHAFLLDGTDLGTLIDLEKSKR